MGLFSVFLIYHANIMIIIPTKINHEYTSQSINAVNNKRIAAIVVKISSLFMRFQPCFEIKVSLIKSSIKRGKVSGDVSTGSRVRVISRLNTG